MLLPDFDTRLGPVSGTREGKRVYTGEGTRGMTSLNTPPTYVLHQCRRNGAITYT